MDFTELQQILDNPNSTLEQKLEASAQISASQFAGDTPISANELSGSSYGGMQPQAPQAPQAPNPAAGFAQRPQAAPVQAPQAPQPQQGPAVPQMPAVDDGPVKRELNTSRRKAGEAGESYQESAEDLEQAATAEADAEKTRGETLEGMRRDVQELQTIRRRDLADAQANLESYSAAYSQALREGTAPSAGLLERETRDAVISNIVMGLGALAQIVTGGATNGLAGMAEGIMNRASKAIQRDIQTKFNRIDSAGKARTLAERQIQSIRQNFSDDRSALEFLTQVEIDARIRPKLAQAAKSKNMAAAAAAQAAGAVFEAQEARARAAIQKGLVGDAQRRAEIGIALRQKAMEEANQVPDAFEVSKNMGVSAKAEVRKDYDNIYEFARDAKRLAELNRKINRFAKMGDWAAYIAGGGSVKEARELNGLVIRLFKANTNLGQALTPTEIEFGMKSLGIPLSVFTDPAALDAAMQQEFAAKVSSFKGRSGVRLTARGEAQLAKTISMFGGLNPAPRNDTPKAKR